MRPGIFGKYDRIRVISLPNRKDRRRAMSRELRGIPFAFFDAYRVNLPGLFSSPGALGGVLSHVQALAEAAADGESILILEDDCTLGPEVWTFDPPDCDILWAGWESRTKTAPSARNALAIRQEPRSSHRPMFEPAGSGLPA